MSGPRNNLSPLGTLGQFHILLFLFQTHPAAQPEQRLKSCLLNVNWSDLVDSNVTFRVSMQRVLQRLFTTDELKQYSSYVSSAMKLLHYSDTSASSSHTSSSAQLSSIRHTMCKKYLLTQPFLLQDFCMKLIEYWIWQQQQQSSHSETITTRTPTSSSVQLNGPEICILFHVQFVDERRSERTMKLELEALSAQVWHQLLQELKQRVFSNEQLPHISGEFGTCSNGQETQWYVEFNAPASYFHSLDMFHPGLRRQFFWSPLAAEIQYLFVAVRTPFVK